MIQENLRTTTSTMILTKLPFLSSVAYVLKFRALDRTVRFKQAQIEAAFSGFLNGQSQQTNVPDQADPNQTRIIFGNETKSLAVSQVGCQFSMSFFKSGISVERQLEVCHKNVVDFYERVIRAFGTDAINQSGLVFEITYASEVPPQTLHQYVADRFYKGPIFGEIASTQFAIGFKKNDLFLNMAAGVYETRKFEFVAPRNASNTVIDVASLPIDEYGLTFKVDVNDRPRQRDGEALLTPADELLKVIYDFFSDNFAEFSGLSLIES